MNNPTLLATLARREGLELRTGKSGSIIFGPDSKYFIFAPDMFLRLLELVMERIPASMAARHPQTPDDAIHILLHSQSEYVAVGYIALPMVLLL